MNIRTMKPKRLVIALLAAGLVGGTATSLISGSHAHAASPTTLVGAATSMAGGAPGGIDFSQIAERYGKRWIDIAVANRLDDVDHIEVGQTLVIPAQGVAR